MNLENVKVVELELSSDCNAACPLCVRNKKNSVYDISNISLGDIKRLFPYSDNVYVNTEFVLSGVIGDPVLNPEFIQIVEYLISLIKNSKEHNRIHVNTNGGIQTSEFWSSLGKISKQTNKLKVHFAVDGMENTNHLYRLRTKFEVIKRNMQAYSNAGGLGQWMFIIFDHNKNDLSRAKEFSDSLNFEFVTRQASKNSIKELNENLNNDTKPIVQKLQKVDPFTSDKKFTSEFNEVKKIISQINNNNIDESLLMTIRCKHFHDNEIFIASDLTLWPCCYLWGEYVQNIEKMSIKMNLFDEWNSLKTKSISDVLSHEWYTHLLRESWNINNPAYIKKCTLTCAKEGVYQMKTDKIKIFGYNADDPINRK